MPRRGRIGRLASTPADWPSPSPSTSEPQPSRPEPKRACQDRPASASGRPRPRSVPIAGWRLSRPGWRDPNGPAMTSHWTAVSPAREAPVRHHESANPVDDGGKRVRACLFATNRVWWPVGCRLLLFYPSSSLLLSPRYLISDSRPRPGSGPSRLSPWRCVASRPVLSSNRRGSRWRDCGIAQP